MKHIGVGEGEGKITKIDVKETVKVFKSKK